jgi:L-xylulokinase
LGIQSFDSRAAALSVELDRAFGTDLHRICGQRPWPSQTPTLLVWVKVHQPAIYARAGTQCFAKDIISWHLTGQRASDVSDMSGAGLLRWPEASNDAGLLSLYGLSDAMPLLPRLCQPTEVVGHVTPAAASATGLRAGTPVIAGYFDVVASALGSGAVEPGTALIVLGSWSINQVFADMPARDPNGFMVAAFGPGRFASMDKSATSVANLEWYVRTLIERNSHKGDAFVQVNALVGQAAIAPEDPMFDPFLCGGRHGAHQRGGFYGLAGWHGVGHLLRALYEGVAFEYRRHIGVLTRTGSGTSQVFLSGGGTGSPHWPQMMADALGLSVRLGTAGETGALGGAMTAAVGIGLYANEEAAVAAMTPQRAVLFPDPDRRSLHDRRFAVRQRLAAAMEPFWADLADLRRS